MSKLDEAIAYRRKLQTMIAKMKFNQAYYYSLADRAFENDCIRAWESGEEKAFNHLPHWYKFIHNLLDK